jgi:flagellar basal-body rod protein FlgG
MFAAKMIAASGLRNQQARLDTISDNVANVNTMAFNRSRLDFKDALYTTGITPGPPRTPAPGGNQQRGNGVMIGAITRCFTPGALIRTDRDLDLAITGDGFFELEDENGNSLYTRNGGFHLSVNEEGTFIVSATGKFLLDSEGERIQVPEGTSNINIDREGVISFTVDDEITTVNLGIHTFRNITGLVSEGSGYFSETPAAGERLPADEAEVLQGMREGSNVDLAFEVTRLIRTHRAYSMAATALRTADEMEAIANNMRR